MVLPSRAEGCCFCHSGMIANFLDNLADMKIQEKENVQPGPDVSIDGVLI
jgi:hypothetical protein